jgi:hypothetical protein
MHRALKSSSSRLLMLALLALGLHLAYQNDARAEQPARIVYSGRLQNTKGGPIGGVYPLTFTFYKAEKGGRAVWSEAQFVAVDNGVYAVELGRKKPLPKGLDVSKTWLGVSITGGNEILREPLQDSTEVVGEAPAKPPADPTIGAPPQPAKGTYADTAGFAQEAERAKRADTADSIGGMTAADLKALATKTTQAAAAGGSKAKLGAALRYTDAAGGGGGQEFTLQCPPGHVATGIRGRGAMMIDQISVICAPLE